MDLAIPWVLVVILLAALWLTRVRPERPIHFQYTYRYKPPSLAIPKEPWRNGIFADQTVLLPLDWVMQLADPKELRENLRKEREYLDQLKADVSERGITDPFVAVIDQLGRITLQDGHHRSLVAEELGETLVPVRFLPSDRIRKHCVPLVDILPTLLLGRYTR